MQSTLVCLYFILACVLLLSNAQFTDFTCTQVSPRVGHAQVQCAMFYKRDTPLFNYLHFYSCYKIQITLLSTLYRKLFRFSSSHNNRLDHCTFGDLICHSCITVSLLSFFNQQIMTRTPETCQNHITCKTSKAIRTAQKNNCEHNKQIMLNVIAVEKLPL